MLLCVKRAYTAVKMRMVMNILSSSASLIYFPVLSKRFGTGKVAKAVSGYTEIL